jgi:uncharacterized protein (TIGR00725 family)
MIIKQIWIIWSAWTNLTPQWCEFAYNLGKALAKYWYTLMYGAEKDVPSISMHAAQWAYEVWWNIVALLYGKYDNSSYQTITHTQIIHTGLERWWWREFVFINSCDLVITIGWWTGTLNELTIAYQNKIPIITVVWSWWWADKLSGSYLDDRYLQDPARFPCHWCSTVEEIIEYISSLQ